MIPKEMDLNEQSQELTDKQKSDIVRYNLTTQEEIAIYLKEGLVHFEKIIAAYENHALGI